MPGSRTLTGPAATNAALTSAQAINAVKIEWGGSTGTLWYSDHSRTEDGQGFAQRVIDWGTAQTDLRAGGHWGFSLRDEDGAIRAILKAEGTAGKPVTLYQLWIGSSQADWVVLWKGVTDSKWAWSETDYAVSIACVSYAQVIADSLLTEVSLEDFPYAAPETLGRALP